MTNGVRLLRLLDFSSCDLPVFSATRQSVPFGWESRTQKVLRRIIHTCSVPRIFSAWDSDVTGDGASNASGWLEPQRRDKLGFEWNDRKLLMGLCCWRSP